MYGPIPKTSGPAHPEHTRRMMARMLIAARTDRPRSVLATYGIVTAEAAFAETMMRRHGLKSMAASYRAIKEHAKWAIGQFAYDGSLERPLVGLRRGTAARRCKRA